MSKAEVIRMIRRNGHNKKRAIVFLMDFLLISRDKAKQIYAEEFENVR